MTFLGIWVRPYLALKNYVLGIPTPKKGPSRRKIFL